MAPEQIDNYGKVTTQADVWAFGMTVLVRMLPVPKLIFRPVLFQELFTQEPPYHNIRDTRGVIQRILQGQPDRPTDETTHGRMTDQWWEICCLCWKRDESSRPLISDIVAVIVSILFTCIFSTFNATQEKAEVSSRRTRSFRMPLYVTLFTACLLTLLYFLIRITGTT